jgi:hypothetical protein
MLEADPVHRVGELDVDREVVAVQLQLVVVAVAPEGLDRHRERGDIPSGAQLPVPVGLRMGLESDRA